MCIHLLNLLLLLATTFCLGGDDIVCRMNGKDFRNEGRTPTTTVVVLLVVKAAAVVALCCHCCGYSVCSTGNDSRKEEGRRPI